MPAPINDCSAALSPKAQNLWPFRRLGHIEMGDEKIWIRRLEYHDVRRRIRLEVSH